MKRSSLSHSLLNIILVFIESALTLLLRLDPKLRRAAYPLAKHGTVVCLRLYVPHVEVFATFSAKGVLLDAALPADSVTPDVVINAYSIHVLSAITTHDTEHTDKLQMRGDTEQVAQVKQFITQLGLASLIQGIVTKIKGEDKAAPSEADKAAKTEHYKTRINEQQNQINVLTIKNRELDTTVQELKSRQKIMTIITVIAVIIAIAAIIGIFVT